VATLLWESVRHEAKLNSAQGMNDLEAIQLAGDVVVARQVRSVAFPKRFTLQAREIWTFQERLKRRAGKRAEILFAHPRFRAAYDLLLLRAQCGEEVEELAEWWTRFQETDISGRHDMATSVGQAVKRKRKPRRKRPSSQSPAGNNG
jgi:poly(A) polymerase